MATQKQKAAARRNVKKAQAGAQKKETLKHLSKKTKSELGKEANKVRRGEAKTRKELNEEAAKLEIKGRSKMGKDELRRAISRAR
jgi:hypothetical protein